MSQVISEAHSPLLIMPPTKFEFPPNLNTMRTPVAGTQIFQTVIG